MLRRKHPFPDGHGFQQVFQGFAVAAQIAVSNANVVIGLSQVRMLRRKHPFPDGHGFQFVFQGLAVAAQIAVSNANVVIGLGQLRVIRGKIRLSLGHGPETADLGLLPFAHIPPSLAGLQCPFAPAILQLFGGVGQKLGHLAVVLQPEIRLVILPDQTLQVCAAGFVAGSQFLQADLPDHRMDAQKPVLPDQPAVVDQSVQIVLPFAAIGRQEQLVIHAALGQKRCTAEQLLFRFRAIGNLKNHLQMLDNLGLGGTFGVGIGGGHLTDGGIGEIFQQLFRGGGSAPAPAQGPGHQIHSQGMALNGIDQSIPLLRRNGGVVLLEKLIQLPLVEPGHINGMIRIGSGGDQDAHPQTAQLPLQLLHASRQLIHIVQDQQLISAPIGQNGHGIPVDLLLVAGAGIHAPEIGGDAQHRLLPVPVEANQIALAAPPGICKPGGQLRFADAAQAGQDHKGIPAFKLPGNICQLPFPAQKTGIIQCGQNRQIHGRLKLLQIVQLFPQIAVDPLQADHIQSGQLGQQLGNVPDIPGRIKGEALLPGELGSVVFLFAQDQHDQAAVIRVQTVVIEPIQGMGDLLRTGGGGHLNAQAFGSVRKVDGGEIHLKQIQVLKLGIQHDVQQTAAEILCILVDIGQTQLVVQADVFLPDGQIPSGSAHQPRSGSRHDTTSLSLSVILPFSTEKVQSKCAAVQKLRRIAYSSKRGVEKYRSAVSGRMVTTVLPGPSFLARAMAAATLVPEEMPHIRPSSRARSRAVCRASSSETM